MVKDQFVLVQGWHPNLFYFFLFFNVCFYLLIGWLIWLFLFCFSSKKFSREANEKDFYIKVTKF